MFKHKLCSLAPRHLPALSTLIDDLHERTPAAIAAHLEVSSLTVRRWIAADQAPRAACLALFYETRWGLSALDCEAVNLVRLTSGLNSALRRENAGLTQRIAYLESVGHFGSANAPAFSVPFLSCLCGSERGLHMKGTAVSFLSCLCGSERI